MTDDEHEDDNQHDSKDFLSLQSFRDRSHQDDTRGYQNDGWNDNHNQSGAKHAIKQNITWMLTKDGIDWCCNGLVQLPIKDIVCCDFKPSSQIEDYTEDQNTNDAKSQPVEMVRFKPIDDFGEC